MSSSKSKLTKQEYEEMFYGYTIESFCEESSMYIKSKIQQVLEEKTRKMLENYKNLSENDIKEAIAKVEENILKSMKDPIEKLNEVVNEVLGIPSDVDVFPGHYPSKENLTDDQIKKMDEENRKLEKECQQNAIFLKSLEAEAQGYQGTLNKVYEDNQEIIETLEKNPPTIDHCSNLEFMKENLKIFKHQQEDDEKSEDTK